MTSTMEKLIERIQSLSDKDQDAYAQFMLEDLDELQDLRKQLDPAIAQLDRGEGVPFEGAASFISRMKTKHGVA